VGLKTITVSYRDEINEPQFAHPKVLSSVPGLGDWRRVLLVDDVWVTGKSWKAAREHLPATADVLPFVLSGGVDFALIRGSEGFVRWPWHPA
jgi:pyrimidine operon attenuation protein/uracil phosphoribosyltransferase